MFERFKYKEGIIEHEGNGVKEEVEVSKYFVKKDIKAGEKVEKV